MASTEFEIKFKQLISDGGLSPSDVQQRQTQEGFNELPQAKPKRIFSIILDVIKEPMVYLLLAGGGIYLSIGDRQEALMLIFFLLLIIGITVVQETKAERALQALKDLSSPRALVFRNGGQQRIAGKEVVRDDIIFLNEGDRVPADAILMSDDIIGSDESLISGESIPVDKIRGSHLFAGATIVHGQGMALVQEIGAHTELGKIGKSLQSVQNESTELEKQTNQLVKRVAWFAGVLCVLVAVVQSLHESSWLEGSFAGLSLAMAIMPNELPAVLTIFLALGAWRLSHRRVLTRNISAVENLGSATILCVDKTGTLTLNQMAIQKIFSQGKSIDLLTLPADSLAEEFHEALEFGILASKKDPFDPMEIAFKTAGIKFLQGTEHLHDDWLLKKEYPLSPGLLSISHAWKPSVGGGFVIGAKGAPEAIIDLCHLPQNEAEMAREVVEKMASEGLRVIGVAKAFSPEKPLPAKQHDFDFKLVGFIGLTDPVRPEVPKALAECRNAGIRVVMITGDHPKTASCIAKQIGLQNPDNVLTGADFENMSDEELSSRAKSVSVFSRVMPAQKLRLVNSLKMSGEVVAMTGDGVNDAPALKSAHIGIAMGGRGTDVAREASDIVLLDDDFASIVEAIRMGRRIYANLRSAMIFLFAVHIPIAGMSIIPVFMGLPLVFFPAHIALLHLIIEPASSIAFEVEPTGPELMDQPPRKIGDKLFGRNVYLPSFMMGVSILIALIAVYFISLNRGQGERDSRTLVFTTLMISNVVIIFMSRRSELSFMAKLRTRPTRALSLIVLFSFLLLVLILYQPALRELFSFSFLHPMDIFICLLLGIGSVVLVGLIQPSQRKS